jgi:Iap family predicted aminopeptidase
MRDREAFPLPFSANKKVINDVLPDVMEQGNTWLLPLYNSEEEAGDPHFDWEKKAWEKAKDAATNGATALVLYDNYGSKYPPEFNSRSEYDALDIPVVYVAYNPWQTQTSSYKGIIPVELNINMRRPERTAHNIAAYIDNKAPYTVVIGAHYDHLGHGEDGNSLYAGKDRPVFNGADDNASGTAALLELAAWLKKSRLRKYNYLFVHFSGEELGLLGSKAFIKEQGIDSAHIAYMINMDMIGRLNDSTHALTLGGVGTSPAWGSLPALAAKEFKLNLDSSGVGPSDHSSFYNQHIPVLFLFTGTHYDYHKPTDDADKINYTGELSVIRYITRIITAMDKGPRPAFTPTKQNSIGRVRFKVTLGIMPDYSYGEEGVRVDGVSEGKPAHKAGIKAGDIITGLGEDKIKGMQSYMESLGRQKEGGKTTVIIRRAGKELKLPIEFK